MTLPAKSPTTLAFGATSAPYSPSSPHKGTDFAHVPDNKIYAPFSGKVSLIPNNGKDGNGIYMTAPNGDFHGMLHSSQYLVANGAQVSEGQPIGVMGDTGYAFGVHLHWCVKRNGVFIDPMNLITKGHDMLTPGQLDKLIKVMKQAEPSAAELNNQDWLNDAGLAIDALWNNYGKNHYPPTPQGFKPYTPPPLFVKE